MHDLQEENRGRLGALRRRTILVGVVALVTLVTGGLGMVGVGRRLLAAASGSPTDIPALDVPDDLVRITFADNLALAFWVLVLLLLVALSTGRLRRLHLVAAMALTMVVGAVSTSIAGYTTSPLLILPSQLERDINDGNLGRPLQWMQGLGSHYATKEQVMYLKAQIALRDPAAGGLMESAGKPFLDLVEEVTYNLNIEDRQYSGAMYKVHYFVLGFHAEVIHALDRRLHGEPMTGVGMAFERRFGGVQEVQSSLGGFDVLRAAVLLLGMLLVRLWWTMRSRVDYIDTTLNPVFTVSTVTVPEGGVEEILRQPEPRRLREESAS